MTEQEQVQLLPCPFCGGEGVILWFESIKCSDCGAEGPDAAPLLEAIAAWNTRHTATAEALEAMREAQEALAGLVSFERPVGAGDGRTFTMSVPAVSSIDKARQAFTRLTAAIAKIEGDAECDGRALAALTYQDGQRSAPDGGN